MKPLSKSVGSLQRSGIRAVMDIAFRRPGVLRLEVGDPDFPTPPHIVEAAAQAARAGYTHYTPSRGLPEVREVMADKLTRLNGIRTGSDDVVVAAGGGHALFSVYQALADPGDAVLVPDPGWPNYRTIAGLCGLEVVGYPLEREHGFLPDLEQLDRLMSTSGIKFVVLNSPSNPTGAVWPRSTIESMVELCSKHDVYLVADECYEAIVFDAEHVSPASFDQSGRTVSVFTVSKTYAMTGWRVGYVTGSNQVVESVGKVVENSVSCASAVSQKAAEAAIAGDQSAVEEMVAEYRSRRDLAMAELGEAGLSANRPGGAFYVMVEVPADDTVVFAMEFVDAEEVTVAPGEAFGHGGAGMVRLSLASDRQTIAEGIRRLGRFVHGSRDGMASG
ncbi:MAG TPA: aminotransferase class I/II-fold pyridoxal phosphate-dependent enzyme [Acidimicrobiia bacterium]|nr:aminotransferase class I/II-fold pyridoxal phosphate-dependent enzyme [Acidimicrobiia bacterium]